MHVRYVEGLGLALGRDSLPQITAQQCILLTVDVDGLGQKSACSDFEGLHGNLTAAVAGEYCDDCRWGSSFDDLDYVEAAVPAETKIDHCEAIIEVGLVLDGLQSIEPLHAVSAIHEFDDKCVGKMLVVVNDQQRRFAAAQNPGNFAGR